MSGPNVINLPIATVDGQTKNNYSLSENEINSIISELPLILNTDTEKNTYTETGPVKGKIFSISTFVIDDTAKYGPWIDVDTSTNTPYLNYYYKIQNYTEFGNINTGTSTYSFTFDKINNLLIISTNFIPYHTTGIYPMPKTSQCYPYDPDNSTTTIQNVVMTLPLKPVYSNTPQPVSLGIQGYCFDNSAFFMGLDEDANDAVSLRCLDNYWGHPQQEGIYHHHTTPFAIINNTIDTKVRVVGFALDGFPIVAPYLVLRSDGSYSPLTTDDLDECHGMYKNITFTFQGESLTYTYFYVTSLDFPYWISAFRGSVIGTYTNYKN